MVNLKFLTLYLMEEKGTKRKFFKGKVLTEQTLWLSTTSWERHITFAITWFDVCFYGCCIYYLDSSLSFSLWNKTKPKLYGKIFCKGNVLIKSSLELSSFYCHRLIIFVVFLFNVCFLYLFLLNFNFLTLDLMEQKRY